MSSQTEYRLETVALVAAALISRRSDVDFRTGLSQAAEDALALLDACRNASLDHYRRVNGLEEGPHVPGQEILTRITGIKKRSDARRAYTKYLQWLKSTDLPALALKGTDQSVEILRGPPPPDIPTIIARIERVGASERAVTMQREGYEIWWSKELASVREKSGSSRPKPKRRWKSETIRKHLQKKVEEGT